MIRTYHGITYQVLDLAAFRSGYLGQSSLCGATPDVEVQRPTQSGLRVPRNTIQKVERAINAGMSHRRAAKHCGVSSKTV